MIFLNLNDVRNFAIKKHEGQTRPNLKKEPKSIHITEVANWVKKAGGSNLAIAAAYLHDTLEDTSTTFEEINKTFSFDLAYIVNELTDPIEFYQMNLSLRKQKQADKMKNTKHDTKLVKIADQLSNISSIYKDPPLDWDNEKCLEYLIGAKKIVNSCEGINKFLEDKFNTKYYLAIIKYS